MRESLRSLEFVQGIEQRGPRKVGIGPICSPAVRAGQDAILSNDLPIAVITGS